MSKAHAKITPLFEAQRLPRVPFGRRKKADLTTVDAVKPHVNDPLEPYRKRYLLSIPETAELLGLPAHLVYRAIRRNDPLFPFVRIGRRVLIQRAGVFAAFGLD